MNVMGVIFDYFAAPSDESAVATIDRVSGPAAPNAPAPHPVAKRRSLFGRTKSVAPASAPKVANNVPAYDTVELKGVDPIVMISTLEFVLTGVAYQEIIAGPRAGRVLDSRDGGERLVIALSDGIQEALASADRETIDRVAPVWLRTDEFAMSPGWSVAEVSNVVRDLSSLARRSKERGDKLYCWVCV